MRPLWFFQSAPRLPHRPSFNVTCCEGQDKRTDIDDNSSLIVELVTSLDGYSPNSTLVSGIPSTSTEMSSPEKATNSGQIASNPTVTTSNQNGVPSPRPLVRTRTFEIIDRPSCIKTNDAKEKSINIIVVHRV